MFPKSPMTHINSTVQLIAWSHSLKHDLTKRHTFWSEPQRDIQLFVVKAIQLGRGGFPSISFFYAKGNLHTHFHAWQPRVSARYAWPQVGTAEQRPWRAEATGCGAAAGIRAHPVLPTACLLTRQLPSGNESRGCKRLSLIVGKTGFQIVIKATKP